MKAKIVLIVISFAAVIAHADCRSEGLSRLNAYTMDQLKLHPIATERQAAFVQAYRRLAGQILERCASLKMSESENSDVILIGSERIGR